jgi:hypothetical protein
MDDIIHTDQPPSAGVINRRNKLFARQRGNVFQLYA